MSYAWRNTSIKIILVLFCACVLLFAFSFVSHAEFTGKQIAEAYNLPVGQSVYEGDSVLGDNEMMEVPLLANANFLVTQIVDLDLSGLLVTLTTGAVPLDFTTVSSEHIDAYGKATGFDGPGYITYDGDKLTVKAPDNYIWGYSVPYKVLTKTDSGVDLVENGTVIQSIPEAEIKNQNWSNEFYNITSVQSWYNYDADVGDNFTLEKGISGFSDGRSNVSADKVYDIFGKEIGDYVAAYPVGTPIVLYMGNTTNNTGEVYGTTLGSHPEYGDTIREYNARQFVEAWNNTIIPPHSSGNGRDYVDFGSASDSSAPGGSASHGVCPPARALRTAVLADNLSLPVGMCNDEDAVLFGYNPARDIKITNDFDVPIKIVMWTEGSGTGMGIYAEIIKLDPA